MQNSENCIKTAKYNLNGKTVIISRTDSIGDVVLALPVAGVLRQLFPECRIIFLGRSYTAPLIRNCRFVDEFVDWDEIRKGGENEQLEKFKGMKAQAIIHVFPNKDIAKLAFRSGIAVRVGTAKRIFHWLTCNKRIWLSRRRSSLHESQLNLRLLVPFGANRNYRLSVLPDFFGLNPPDILPNDVCYHLDNTRFNLILHPLSKGSAREWKIENYVKLVKLLPQDKFNLFITGTAAEGEEIGSAFAGLPLTNLCGTMDLGRLIAFIANADGLIAASTGPLHIAAALGKYAIGLFPPIRPMHPGRWAPLGANASTMVSRTKCSQCRRKNDCECMNRISPEEVKGKLMEIFA